MRAKQYAFAALAVLTAAMGGCTTMKRLAPPGFVKYEDLAGDKPKNPVIQERVKAVKQARDARFPNLSEQPSAAPEPMPVAERDVHLTSLVSVGSALTEQIAADRLAAEIDLTEGVAFAGVSGLMDPQSAAAALKAAVEADKAAAAADKAANQ
jgi:hypothetical protein